MPVEAPLWPWRPRPESDELLSSWLRRVALGNSAKLHTFCNAVWPGLQIWNRDIDCLAPTPLMETMSASTGVPPAQVEATTFRPLVGTLFEDVRVAGPTSWILAVGVYHRTRRRSGQQWCPLCLARDTETYYRRRWRLALASTCSPHGTVLCDHCHECGAPAVPHRGTDPFCHLCKADRREHPVALADSQALQFEFRLAEMLDPDVLPRSELEAQHPLAYYGVVHKVMTTLKGGARSQALRNEVANHWGGDPSPFGSYQLEFMPSEERQRLAALTARAMRGWPWLFVAHCADAGVWKSWAFGDHRPARTPFAYAAPVNRYLTPGSTADRSL